MSARFRTIVCQDADDLARRIAERIVELSTEPGPSPRCIALSGGSTPKRFHEVLAVPPCFERANWRRLEFFFGDERAVPPEHPDSNYGAAAKTLLGKIPSPAHRMPAAEGDAESYERLVRSRVPGRSGAVPAFDLILLGLGRDGHTASLFPGTRALEERERLVVMNDVPQLKTKRMTFTFPLINAAKRVWVMIAGQDKREIVARCSEARARGEKTTPILGVEPVDGELIWWLDEAAAGT